MFCESCGSLIPDGNSFCSNCGAPVVARPVAPEPAPAAPAPAPAPVVAQAVAPAPAPSVQPAQPVYQQPQAQPVQPVYQQPVQPIYQQPVQPVYQQPQAQPIQPIYQQPVYQQPAVPVAQPVYQQPHVAPIPTKRPNGAATAGLVFGILTLVFCAIPFVYSIFGILALIFSIVGIAKRNASGKGKAIAGLILCILGVAAGIAIQTLFWNVVGNEAEKVYESIMDEYDAYDTSSNGNNNFYIDGDFVDTQNGYVTGNLHIDGYRVQF